MVAPAALLTPPSAPPPPDVAMAERAYTWLGRRWSLQEQEWLEKQHDWPENQDVSCAAICCTRLF